MSKICLTLTESSVKEALEVVESYKESIDLVELRIDFLEEAELNNLHQFIVDYPVILTYRKEVDGGEFSGGEEFRIQILEEALLTGNFSYIDLEEDLKAPDLERIARERGVKIIRSFHDFNGLPDNLSERLLKMKRSEDEIPKAAVMVSSTRELLEFYREVFKILDDKKIVLAMGTYGFNSRILAGKINSYLSFSSKEGSETAPGHISPKILKDVYRFSDIDSDTPLMGIIGNPVMHTKSPLIHNRGYTALDIPGVYVPFETDSLEDFMKIAELLDIKGFSVTVPFKNDIIPLLNSVTPAVEAIGACNTVYRESGSWIGDNTDYIGFINPLIKEFGKLKGKKVTVIGAGGAAKAAVYALKEEGAEVLILNRTVEKARELAESFNSFYEPLNSYSDDKIKLFSDVIIQTTNVGMHPMEHIDPLNFYKYKGSEFLYDIIYSPEKTVFLKSGEEKGCKILNGWEMLLEQGYRQFKIFTGKGYPV